MKNMKKVLLLISLATVSSITTTTSIIGSITGTNFYAGLNAINLQTKKNSNFSNNIIYYKADASAWEITINNDAIETKNYFRWTVLIPRDEFDSYTHVQFYDPNNESYAKVSWGNTAYYGDGFRHWPPISINDDMHVTDINDPSVDWTSRADMWGDYPGLFRTVWGGLAKMEARQAVGFSYIPYYEGRDKIGYKFSIFGYQKTRFSTWATSGGTSWTNLGKGLYFS